MSEVDFKVTNKAYSKMMLHILKHLKSDCYGVLIGKITSKDDSFELVEVVDTYALSHDKVLIPQLDLFLKMLEKKLFGSEYYVIGYYENLIINFEKETPKPSLSSYFMCDGLTSNKKTKRPYVIEVVHRGDCLSNDKKRTKDNLEYYVYRYSNSNFETLTIWKENEDLFNIMKDLISKFFQSEVCDFDDHLLDPKLDYTNSFLDEYILSFK